MRKFIYLILCIPFVASCNSKGNDAETINAQTTNLIQGKWYTTTLEANGQIIITKEHPEALSSFVFKDDKVKLVQMGNHSENGGIFKISNDTIYIYDLINNTNVMTAKIDTISDNNLNLSILGQDVKMKLERMEE